MKKTPAIAGDTGSIPGLGRSPGKGNGNLLQYSCPEDKGTKESQGQRNLVGQSPQSRRVRYNCIRAIVVEKTKVSLNLPCQYFSMVQQWTHPMNRLVLPYNIQKLPINSDQLASERCKSVVLKMTFCKSNTVLQDKNSSYTNASYVVLCPQKVLHMGSVTTQQEKKVGIVILIEPNQTHSENVYFSSPNFYIKSEFLSKLSNSTISIFYIVSAFCQTAEVNVAMKRIIIFAFLDNLKIVPSKRLDI